VIFSACSWHLSRQDWQKVWKQGRTLGETKVELQTGHLVLEEVKLLPPSGDVDRPEVLLAEPVLALSREAAEELPEETPEEEKACGKVSSP